MTQRTASEADYNKKQRRKLSRTQEKPPLQENRTAKRAKVTKNEEKQNRVEDQNNEDETPIEMQQEDHEPDTLEQLLGEWMDKEEDPENKADKKFQTSGTQEKERRKNTEHCLRSRLLKNQQH